MGYVWLKTVDQLVVNALICWVPKPLGISTIFQLKFNYAKRDWFFCNRKWCEWGIRMICYRRNPMVVPKAAEAVAEVAAVRKNGSSGPAECWSRSVRTANKPACHRLPFEYESNTGRFIMKSVSALKPPLVILNLSIIIGILAFPFSVLF